MPSAVPLAAVGDTRGAAHRPVQPQETDRRTDHGRPWRHPWRALPTVPEPPRERVRPAPPQVRRQRDGQTQPHAHKPDLNQPGLPDRHRRARVTPALRIATLRAQQRTENGIRQHRDEEARPHPSAESQRRSRYAPPPPTAAPARAPPRSRSPPYRSCGPVQRGHRGGEPGSGGRRYSRECAARGAGAALQHRQAVPVAAGRVEGAGGRDRRSPHPGRGAEAAGAVAAEGGREAAAAAGGRRQAGAGALAQGGALDNYVTHKTPAIKKWLLAHPRFHLHFTPTSSSWLNLVERWFAELTQKKLKRGVHRSVQALERDIRSWLADWNDHPRPFVWTKTADETLDKVAAYCRRISDSDH